MRNQVSLSGEPPVRCQRCGRRLRAAQSVAASLGPGCRARIRAAALSDALRAWTGQQIDKALELITDKGIVRAGMAGVFRTVSSDGQSCYLSAATGCNCRAGLNGRRCYHTAAVVILLAREV